MRVLILNIEKKHSGLMRETEIMYSYVLRRDSTSPQRRVPSGTTTTVLCDQNEDFLV